MAADKEAALAKLQARLAQPPKDWVDTIMVAVVSDPLFYGGLALAVFLLLACLALVATKVLLDQIAADEKRKHKLDKKKKADKRGADFESSSKKDQ